MLTMIRPAHIKRLFVLIAIVLAVVCGTATDARAQGFFTALVGYDYSGDSLCATLRGCDRRSISTSGSPSASWGRPAGSRRKSRGPRNFFGSTEAGADSNVLTVMSNFMIAPKIGPVRPYGLFGVGLMKAHVDLNPIAIVSFTNNTFAWDAGAGLMVMFGQHVGIRGDIRHFASFQDLNLLGLSLGGGTKLSFGRASAALVLQ